MTQSLTRVPALALLVAFFNFPVLAETAPTNNTHVTHLLAAASPDEAKDVPPIEEGASIMIEGSTTMAGINAVLEQRFESQFPGVEVDIEYSSSDTALADLQQGNIDLAAIARPLTAEERAQNFVTVPVSRWKIAVVIGSENPFSGSLRVDQLAKIIRGEITDWSEVGGEPGPIRVVEHAPSSYARQALLTYDIFQRDLSQASDGSEKLSEESPVNIVQLSEDLPEKVIAKMIEELGNDGISYAIAPQVVDRRELKIVPLHNTLPSHPHYPFSKPLSYVFKGPTPSPAAQAYLDYATAPENQGVIEVAERGGALASNDGALRAGAEVASASPATPKDKQPTEAESPQEYAATDESKNYGKLETEKATEPRQASMWRWIIFLPIVGVVIFSLFKES